MNAPEWEEWSCRGLRRMTRRGLLKASVPALVGGTWITQLAEQLAVAAERPSNKSRPKSLLLIWLQGGPSQLETFDPHPGTKIGGDTQSISTTVPGLQISNLLPATAEQMHLATLVRSVVSKEGDHERATYHLKTGWRPDPTITHPAIGSILCHQTDSNIEIPRHISILPSQWPSRGGYLGPSLDAFQIGDPAQPIPNLTRRVDEDRLHKRLGTLLETVETEFQRGRIANLDRNRTLHQEATRQAVQMMDSQQLMAFDVTQEGQHTLGRFGNTAFGRGCLAAVRLLECGVRCVEVELNGWDSHVNNHQLQSNQASILDSALAATLAELEQRKLLDNTVVVCGGEFGRTPNINPAGGRDHWPTGFSTLLAGGGFRSGYVHGATNPQADQELGDAESENTNQAIDRLVERPVTVPDLHATLLHALGIDYHMEMMTSIGRPLRWSDGNAISELLG